MPMLLGRAWPQVIEGFSIPIVWNVITEDAPDGGK